MQFDSPAYLILLSLSFLVFHLGPKSLRVVVLLAASFLFYSSWNTPLLLLVVWSGFLDFYVARRIAASPSPRGRKGWLVVSLVSNLGLLAFFKYTNFILETAHQISAGTDTPYLPWEIILPVGISFYTFQTMSYSIDVYRGDLEPEEDFIPFLLYVSFFPQLIAGPIERAGQLLPQLKSRAAYTLESSHLLSGIAWISWGLFKKMALADNLARIVHVAYGNPEAYGSGDLLIATYAFAFQIFFDFSAYTDIARGSALLFGIKLSENFRRPYLAQSPSDFWRRWHISLSTWIRDYLYRPLGGNRRGRARTLLNLLLTMALAGLWHGAALHFVAWGVYHGLLLVLYRVLHAPVSRLTRGWPPSLRAGLGIAIMFHLTLIGWVLFRAENLATAGLILGRISSGLGEVLAAPGLPAALLLLAVVFLCMEIEEKYALFRRLLSRGVSFVVFMGGLWILTLIFAPEVSTPFIYFQF